MFRFGLVCVPNTVGYIVVYMWLNQYIRTPDTKV